MESKLIKAGRGHEFGLEGMLELYTPNFLKMGKGLVGALRRLKDASLYVFDRGPLIELKIENQNLSLTNESLKNKVKNLQDLSNTDSLTGLINKRGLDEALQRSISQYVRNLMRVEAHQNHNNDTVFVFYDFNRFKAYNSSLGQNAGDALLQAAAEKMDTLRSGDVTARNGGDEFAQIYSVTNFDELMNKFPQEEHCFRVNIDYKDSTGVDINLRNIPLYFDLGIVNFADVITREEVDKNVDRIVDYVKEKVGAIIAFADGASKAAKERGSYPVVYGSNVDQVPFGREQWEKRRKTTANLLYNQLVGQVGIARASEIRHAYIKNYSIEV